MPNVPFAEPINGVPLLQHPQAPWAFYELFQRFHPEVIVEIGTAYGGLTLHLHKLKPPDCHLVSYDVTDMRHAPACAEAGIDFRCRSVFTRESILEISALLSVEGPCLILCDGGNKIREFNLFAPVLKRGDVIMAHDYAPDNETFQQTMKDKTWDWLEITLDPIRQTIRDCNLVPWAEDLFLPVAWGSFRRL